MSTGKRSKQSNARCLKYFVDRK